MIEAVLVSAVALLWLWWLGGTRKPFRDYEKSYRPVIVYGGRKRSWRHRRLRKKRSS